MGIRFYGCYLLSFNSVRNFKYLHLTRAMSDLKPPSSVKGMQILDKKLFNKTIRVPVLVIPIPQLVKCKPILKNYLLKLQNFRPLQELPMTSESDVKDEINSVNSIVANDTVACSSRIVFTDRFSKFSNSKVGILDPSKVINFEDIQNSDRDKLFECDITPVNFFNVDLIIGYDNWKADEILRAIIPDEYEGVSSYSICGHIIHLNLREHLSNFKQIIGQVLLEKIVNCKTVVNKIDNIDNEFRNFKMELIAGEENYVATLKENKCTFVFDFSKVYWNSRLSTEHERIVNKISSSDILYDVFCGVGPFSIPAAKKRCRVLANDLNPESIKWLEESAKINKVDFEFRNKDAKDFILEDLKNDLKSVNFIEFTGKIHIVMNLPALAVEFLRYFKNLYSNEAFESLSNYKEPTVYVYCFTKNQEDPIKAAADMVQDKLGYHFTDELISVNFVRNVAPQKEMMRVDFKLSKNIICNLKRNDQEATENICKKICYN